MGDENSLVSKQDSKPLYYFLVLTGYDGRVSVHKFKSMDEATQKGYGMCTLSQNYLRIDVTVSDNPNWGKIFKKSIRSNIKRANKKIAKLKVHNTLHKSSNKVPVENQSVTVDIPISTQNVKISQPIDVPTYTLSEQTN